MDEKPIGRKDVGRKDVDEVSLDEKTWTKIYGTVSYISDLNYVHIILQIMCYNINPFTLILQQLDKTTKMMLEKQK